LQAKFEETLRQSSAQSLVDDFKDAFANPFTHPTTGLSHRIATFTVANAGSIAPNTRTAFQNGVGHYIGCTRMLDGQALLSLDRYASSSRMESARDLLGGMQRELIFNRSVWLAIQSAFVKRAAGKTSNMPLLGLRNGAISNFLTAPICADYINFEACEAYWQAVASIEAGKQAILFAGYSAAQRGVLCKSLLPEIDAALNFGDALIHEIDQAILTLGPLRAS
jgi:hypothetical protein